MELTFHMELRGTGFGARILQDCQTLPNTEGNLNVCCNFEKNLIFSNMYTDLLGKIEKASERIRTKEQESRKWSK